MTTTSPVSLVEVKLHLRIDTTDDDSVLTGLLVAASQWVEKEANVKLADFDPCPQLLMQAVLLVVGHWFEHREAATDRRISTVPLAVESIIAQFAKPEAV